MNVSESPHKENAMFSEEEIDAALADLIARGLVTVDDSNPPLYSLTPEGNKLHDIREMERKYPPYTKN